jgi:hypothetical protein
MDCRETERNGAVVDQVPDLMRPVERLAPVDAFKTAEDFFHPGFPFLSGTGLIRQRGTLRPGKQKMPGFVLGDFR